MDVYERRVSVLREAMATAGLDALVLYNNGSYHFTEMDPIYYLSGFKPLGPHAVVILPKDDDPCLLFMPVWDQQRASRRSRVQNLRPARDFAREYLQLVTEMGLRKAKVGLTGMGRQNRAVHGLLSAPFEQRPLPADSLVEEAAAVKDDLELSLVEKATEIAERGYAYLLETLRPGVCECTLVGEVDAYMRSLGADDNFLLISASQHNRAVHAPTDRRLDRGDILLAEISPSFEGQFTQICRSVVGGRPTELMREKYGLLIEAMWAGIRRCRSGETAGAAVSEVDRVVSAAGYGKYTVPPYMRTRGHGMGLGSVAPGNLTAGSDFVFRKNMLFVFHPNQYIPETGYFLVGEPIVVGEEGGRPLTGRTAHLDSVE